MSILHSHSQELDALLKAWGAPKHITKFVLTAEVDNAVICECTFYAEDGKFDETLTKKYKLVEIQEGDVDA